MVCILRLLRVILIMGVQYVVFVYGILLLLLRVLFIAVVLCCLVVVLYLVVVWVGLWQMVFVGWLLLVVGSRLRVLVRMVLLVVSIGWMVGYGVDLCLRICVRVMAVVDLILLVLLNVSLVLLLMDLLVLLLLAFRRNILVLCRICGLDLVLFEYLKVVLILVDLKYKCFLIFTYGVEGCPRTLVLEVGSESADCYSECACYLLGCVECYEFWAVYVFDLSADLSLGKLGGVCDS